MAYYGKLPIVLLSELASGKEDSYNCRIAAYLLRHLGESISAEQIARDCFVSKRAVSRFARDVGLEDFMELRELLKNSEKTFELMEGDDSRSQAGNIVTEASRAMEMVSESLDYPALYDLVSDLIKAPRIACMGLLKAETAALNLQSDLAMLGLEAVTKVSFKDQMEYLSHTAEDEVVVIFSYQGIFFDYDLPPSVKEGKAKIWVVTGNPKAREELKKKLPLRGILSFSSHLDLISHPYQLIAVSTIIAQQLASRLQTSR